MSGHRLTYERSGRGLLASCSCGDFHLFAEGRDIEAELTVLNLHVFHVDNPNFGKEYQP